MTDNQNDRVRRIATSSGDVTTVAGSGSQAFADGVGTNAAFNRPSGIVMTSDDSLLFIADFSNHRIRQIDVSSGVVSSLVGTGNYGSEDGTGTR